MGSQASYGTYTSGAHPSVSNVCRHVPLEVTTSGSRMLHTEMEMRKEIVSQGPIAIGIFANNAWFHYRSGTLPASACLSDTAYSPTKQSTNHAIQCVGYDNSEKAWIVMNSWGTSWGVTPYKPYTHVPGKSGFLLLQYGTNACSIKKHPCTAQNVRRLSSASDMDVSELLIPEGE